MDILYIILIIIIGLIGCSGVFGFWLGKRGGGVTDEDIAQNVVKSNIDKIKYNAYYPSNNWSNSDIVLPLDILCNYIYNQGLEQLSENESDKWTEINEDQNGMFNFHIKEGGNFQNYIDKCIIPSMERRAELLEKCSLKKLVEGLIKYLKERYSDDTA